MLHERMNKLGNEPPPQLLDIELPEPFLSPWDKSREAPDTEETSKNQIRREDQDQDPTTNQNELKTRSGRIIHKPEVYDPSPVIACVAYNRPYSPENNQSQELLQPTTIYADEPHPLSMYGAETFGFIAANPDTMHLHEALRQPDKDQFLKAMRKELVEHITRKHWRVVPQKCVPKGRNCLPMVWSMKRKRNPLGEIIKWKARLCAGGHRSKEFVDYWDTYSPVVSWQTIRLIFTLAIINDWHIRSIDFVLAYTQAEAQTDIYLRPPTVPNYFVIPDLPKPLDRVQKVYKLLKNLYGLKDAGRTWNHHLHKGLLARGWKQSKIDECLYMKGDILLILYVDDACLILPSEGRILDKIKSLRSEYDLTDEGPLNDYLGTRFNKRPDGSVELTQPRMIQRILEIVSLHQTETRVKTHDTPAVSVLQTSTEDKPRAQKWHYRSAVGCLSYLQAMVRPDITMAVQQCARYNNAPMRSHEEAVKRICRYLLKTKDRGLILKPDKSKGLECYVDADFAGAWSKHSSHDPKSVHSRTGFCIFYAGCPILWKSKVQSIIALSTTEAEYIALSSALREVIAIIHLLEELTRYNFPIHRATPKFVCRTFEDNQSCIKIATDHRTRPRSKHFALRLHHFRSYIVNKTVIIEHIDTKNQIADLLMKPLPKVQFSHLRRKIMQW